MSVELKTLAMKARTYNKIRKALYKKRLEGFTVDEKVKFFNEIFEENHITHWELINYKQKRRDKRDLLERRKASPQTKSMIKKLNPRKKSLEQHKKDLENSK